MPSHPLNLLVSCLLCFAGLVLMRFGFFFFFCWALTLGFLVIMLKPRGSGLYSYANTQLGCHIQWSCLPRFLITIDEAHTHP